MLYHGLGYTVATVMPLHFYFEIELEDV